MSETFSAIVLGLGAMGSASLYQLARRGEKVLGIDQFSPPHTFGSTHGDTRITRQAIGEGKEYTPLSLRSYELFQEVESLTGFKLLEIAGGLILSSSDMTGRSNVEDFFENTLKAAESFNIRHEVLDAGDIRRRFPQFNVRDNEKGYYEYQAGFLYPEDCIRAQLLLAEKNGASIHTNEKVLSFVDDGKGVSVKTNHGEYRARNLVVSAGPWLPELIGKDLSHLFKVYRQVLYWFDVKDSYDNFVLGKFPIFIWETQGSVSSIYGFPAVNGPEGGFKIATAQYEETVKPDEVDRQVSGDETRAMFRDNVAPFFPAAGEKCVKSAVCLYTMTDGSRFVIDRLPGSQSIIICSPCSGHGFKHSAAIGECVAQIVTEGESKINIGAFKLGK